MSFLLILIFSSIFFSAQPDLKKVENKYFSDKLGCGKVPKCLKQTAQLIELQKIPVAFADMFRFTRTLTFADI